MNREHPLVILGVTGSIAAYKAPAIVRLLQERGFAVLAAMTPAAQHFLGPLTLENLTGAPVYLDSVARRSAELPPELKASGIAHTDLSAATRALLVAPASADIIAKLAHGLADDAVSVLALALPASSPLIIAPAMNPRMWLNPATQANVAILRERGAVIIGPEEGEVACGDTGPGRMSEPEEIAARVTHAVYAPATPRRVLILSGPTREPLDDVRFLSNGSSGRFGAALAEAVFESGDRVTVVSGPAAVRPPSWIETIPVESAEEMLAAARRVDYDVLLAPAAIADYRPKAKAGGKPQKKKSLKLELVATPDVLATLAGRAGRGKRRVVAFAAEENADDVKKAREKGRRKHADFIVLNNAVATMGADDATVKLIDVKSGEVRAIGPAAKETVARELWALLRP